MNYYIIKSVNVRPYHKKTGKFVTGYVRAQSPAGIYGAELLTPVEEKELAAKYRRTGNIKARNKLVEHNQRYIAKVAHEVLRGYKNLYHKDNLDELQQVGNEAFMESLNTFDPKKGRLTTYIDMPVRTYMRRHIEHLLKLASTEESEWKDARGKEGEEEVSRIESIPSGELSPEEETAAKQAKAQLERVMPLLSDQERKVVQGVFWGDKSIEEIATKMKLSRQRVNDIMLGAKAKLKKKLSGLRTEEPKSNYEIREEKGPTEYKVTRKGENWPYRVMGKNPVTGKWQLQITHGDLNFIKEWIESRGGKIVEK
jgi:RNA polymerase sigma factor (sigma-70 family)